MSEVCQSRFQLGSAAVLSLYVMQIWNVQRQMFDFHDQTFREQAGRLPVGSHVQSSHLSTGVYMSTMGLSCIQRLLTPLET